MRAASCNSSADQHPIHPRLPHPYSDPYGHADEQPHRYTYSHQHPHADCDGG